MRDLGYDFVLDAPFGIAGPRGMEAGIVEKLHDAFNQAREDPKVLDVMNRLDYPDRYMDPEGNCSPLCGSLTRVDGIECGLPG